MPPAPALPPLNIPEALLQAMKKKIKGEACEVCSQVHEQAGPYICLKCGSMICVLSSVGGVGVGGKVIHCHTGDCAGWAEKCGPAIRISYIKATKVKLRKMK